jgi:glycosyltransferase involved in cell wall biosynthesis
MVRVSVIIPCYNHGKYLEMAVTSILNQTFQDFEIIIVNDGSTDHFTQNLLSSFNKPKTKVISQVNKGPSAARNAGIQISQGEFIVTLDADDYLEKTFIEKGVIVLEKNSDVGVVSSFTQLFGRKRQLWKPLGGGVKNFLAGNNCSANAMFRKICWSQTKGYDEKMREGYEDWDFWLAITKRGWNVYIIPEVLIFYRKHLSLKEEKGDNIRPELIQYMVNSHKEAYQQYIDFVIYEKEREIIYLKKKCLNRFFKYIHYPKNILYSIIDNIKES